MELLNGILSSLQDFWRQMSETIPRVFVSVMLLLLGWLAAKLIRRLTTRLLKLIRLDEMAEKAGIEDFLLKGGVRYTTVTIIANVVYWFVMFAIMLAVLHSIGLEAAQLLFTRIVLYIPNVLVAVLVLIFGTMFAKFFKGISVAYLSNIGIGGAEIISSIGQYAVLVFVISVALEQLSIGGAILVSAFQISFGALCLALALAFGLGGREWAAHILEKLWKR